MRFTDAVKLALSIMERDGAFARYDWQCCQSCGYAAVPSDHAGPIVFCHRQDVEGSKARDGVVFSFDWQGDGGSQVDAGTLARECFELVGLAVDWDGTPEHRLRVFKAAKA